MSPDIEWHVGEGAERETIVRTPQRKPSRRRGLAVLLVVAIGIGLGLVYRSIPEPPAPIPRPTLIPRATSTPFPVRAPTFLTSVDDTIEREAQALARGDLRGFMRLQDSSDQAWLDWQSATDVFNAWGVPKTGAVYTVVESGTLPFNRAWADVIQFRDGLRFRETRFYRQENDQWVRTRPVTDEAFWGDWRTTTVGHFTVTYRTRDTLLMPLIALRLEEAYQRICRDLHCAENSNAIVADQVNYRVALSAGSWTAGQEVDLSLPSPQIAGLYLPESDSDLSDQTDRFDQMIYRFLVNDLVGRITHSYLPSSSQPTRAALWAQVISNWELARLGIMSENALDWVYLHSLDLPPLESLWDLSSRGHETLIRPELSAFIKFIDETYGPTQVVNLLYEVNVAPTLPEAIKHLGLSFDDLKQKWEPWIEQLVESQS
jgi:hypothetical protein